MAGRLARGIGGLVGLGQEAIQQRKDQKAAEEVQQAHDRVNDLQDPLALQPPSYSDDENDEELWMEDDAQDVIKPTLSHKSQQGLNVEEWADAFLNRHPPRKTLSSRLPAPVLLPQKRPGTRTRGFVRAYAPALEDVGIDQSAWLDFVDGGHDQYSSQNVFNVTNIAVALSVLSYTISCGPSIIVHLSALAVHTSIEAGRRMYITKKTNSYLDEMNFRYFQPHGLYAMIMTYDPSSKEASQVLDFESFTANAIRKNDEQSDSTLRSFKTASGKTMESQFPEICPLVFPDVENASPEQRAKGFKSAMAFARDYYDRRTQATFNAQNPNSKLAVNQKPFAGQYGDPTKFQHSGPIGVLTGGKIDPGRWRHERRQRRREASGRTGLIRPAIQGVRKVFQQRVLYMLVVNMPTEEEMKVAAEMEARMKAEEPNWFEKFQASMR